MTQVDAHTSERPTRLMGTRGSQLAYAIRDFLQRSDVPFEWIELSSDDEAREKAKVGGLRDGRLPVCVLPDGHDWSARRFARSSKSWAGSTTLRGKSTILRFSAAGRRA